MIYLLEDDSSIQNFVLYALKNSGFEAEGFQTPGEFYMAIKKRIPDVLLLDVMLPEEDGIQILKKLRNHKETENLPIILLTAKGSEYDRILGLDSGADDYVSKPFSMMELISRIKALLRRSVSRQTQQENEEWKYGSLYVCPSRHEVVVDGQDVVLTYKEFEMLLLFVRNPKKVFSRDQILQSVWGYEFDGESRTVDVHVRSLRQKLGKAGEYIETVRGFGYKIGKIGKVES